MNQRGFTLIEILVAAGIFSGVIVAGMAFFSSTLKNAEKNRLVRELSQVGRQSVERIEREIRTSYGSKTLAGKRICQAFMITDVLDPIPDNCLVASKAVGSTLTVYRQEGVGQTVTQTTYRPVQVSSSPVRYSVEAVGRTSTDFGQSFGSATTSRLLPDDVAIREPSALSFVGYFPTPSSTVAPHVAIKLSVRNYDFESRPASRRDEKSFSTLVTVRDPHVKY